MTNPKCKVVFFGTPEFAVPLLARLASARFCEVAAVVTQPDKPVGRHHSKPVPSPVKKAAQGLKIAVLEGFDGLKGIRADLGIVVAYGEILPKWLLGHFPLGIVNIHPSLLPKYRGPSPIQATILNRDQTTGVSIIKLDEEMDHGPILAQEKVSLYASHSHPPLIPPLAGEDDMTAGELGERLFQRGAELLIKILPDYIAGRLKPIPQDESLASYTKKLTKEDGKIDWTKSPEEIDARVRAMNPWPGAWTEWKGKRLIIWRASLCHSGAERSGAIESRIFMDSIGRPSASLQNDIIFKEVQLEGKKRMPFAEFLKGHPDFKLPMSS